MYVGLKQPLGDGERCVTPARAAAKETTCLDENINIMAGHNVCFNTEACAIYTHS